MKRPWDEWSDEKLRKLFTEKPRVLDIGGGLRIDRDRNNRYNDRRAKWLTPLVEKIQYVILDKVPDYHPDIVGDVHELPLPDNSEDAIACIAVLEHVENPIKAMEEIYRVLKPGGYALIYVPFLFYYHAAPGYYGDFWRFTKDSLEELSKKFSSREIVSVRGAFETWIKLSPFGRWNMLLELAYMVDRATGKIHSDQTSGYNVFLVK